MSVIWLVWERLAAGQDFCAFIRFLFIVLQLYFFFQAFQVSAIFVSQFFFSFGKVRLFMAAFTHIRCWCYCIVKQLPWCVQQQLLLFCCEPDGQSGWKI